MACWVQRKAPVRLTPTTACHCSNDRSSIGMAGVPMPALLNSMSSRPNFSLVCAKIAFTACGSPTSAGATRLSPVSILAVSSSASRLRPTSTTLQPAADSALATARPTPEPAPVIIAIFVILLPRLAGRSVGGTNHMLRMGFRASRRASQPCPDLYLAPHFL
jgi:hypothetical protein